MTANGWFQIVFFIFVILLTTKPLGVFMTRVFGGEKTFLDPVLRPIENLLRSSHLLDFSLAHYHQPVCQREPPR